MTRSTLSTFLVGVGSAALLATAIHAVPAAATTPTAPTYGAASTESLPIPDTAEMPDAAVDGKDLFRGLHFFQGDFADVLMDAEVIDLPSDLQQQAQDPEAISVVNGIIDAIDSTHPEFFAEFSDDLRSGDPYQVEQALKRGAEQIATHAELADAGNEGGTCAVFMGVLAAGVAVVVVAFGAVVYAAHTVAVADVAVGISPRFVEGGLSAEEFVAAVTPVLAA